MKFSFLFVVPTLNSYQLLPRLISSLQDQTWKDWRLLFVDGPSAAPHRKWIKSCVASESRCSWVQQDPSELGIFGAMNQGFKAALSTEYLCFWGSDDWAPYPSMLEDIAATLNESASNEIFPDLLVCTGRYQNVSSGTLSRAASFYNPGILNQHTYRSALFLGSTPPHQATLFGPGALRLLSRYESGFRIAADLDYFLSFSRFPDILVQCTDLEIVHMADGGVSGQYTKLRLQEVRRAYARAFGWLWALPFVARYIRRIIVSLKNAV